MQDLINTLLSGLQNNDSIEDYLTKNTPYIWQKNYPIAIVHEQKRVEDAEVLAKLQEFYFFGEDGFSQEKYTPKMIEIMQKEASGYIKFASFVAHKGSEEHAYTFKEKFKHDKWKKLVNTQNYQAFIQSSLFDANTNTQSIETELRDIMRSAKEIPTLKNIAFIWIAEVSKDTQMQAILKHYFGTNHKSFTNQNTQTYIAYADALKNINMRYFVHTPS